MRPDSCRLTEADISSVPNVSRRVILYSLGFGSALAATVGWTRPVRAGPGDQPRRDPCRDRDRSPPGDQDGCARPPIS